MLRPLVRSWCSRMMRTKFYHSTNSNCSPPLARPETAWRSLSMCKRIFTCTNCATISRSVSKLQPVGPAMNWLRPYAAAHTRSTCCSVATTPSMARRSTTWITWRACTRCRSEHRDMHLTLTTVCSTVTTTRACLWPRALVCCSAASTSSNSAWSSTCPNGRSKSLTKMASES
uniref:Uncharacterized protein n=1 Tax=Lotus japonicus TaxID=34305 RepID=I3SX56_LOTJA|nr:unknown [Lotus japonicus]